MAAVRAPSERVVQQLWGWMAALQGDMPLRSDDGRALRVLYAGRSNPDAGPDFLDALVVIAAPLRAPHGPPAAPLPTRPARGAVEVHRRPADWVTHGHHRDPRYSGVLLHVVYEEDGSGATTAANGRRIPRLALAPLFRQHSPMLPALLLRRAPPEPFPCQRAPAVRLVAALDRAGDARFAGMVERWCVALERACGPGHAGCAPHWLRSAPQGQAAAVDGAGRWPPQFLDQLLWEGVAEALGYRPYSAVMRALAVRLPLAPMVAALEGVAAAERAAAAESWLLAAGGLLPSQRHTRRALRPAAASYAARLEAHRRSLPPALAGGPIAVATVGCGSPAGRSRPGNSPGRRVAALARLACRWPAPSMSAAVLMALARPGASARDRVAHLRALVCGEPEGGRAWEADFWRTHWDFFTPVAVPAGCAPALLGAGRAADVVVNVLLPFAAAVAAARGQGSLAEAAWDTYRQHPPLAENWVTRTVRERVRPASGSGNRRQMGGGGGAVAKAEADAEEGVLFPAIGSARRQQGLLHVYQTVCGDLRCQLCPLAAAGEGTKSP